jgi:hypothetical protein
MNLLAIFQFQPAMCDLKSGIFPKLLQPGFVLTPQETIEIYGHRAFVSN